MSELQKKHKQLKRLRIRNITLNTVCILLALAGISWTINYFWKYVHYEITNDAVVDQYIAPLNIRASGYIKEVRFTEHQPVHAGDTLLILDNRDHNTPKRARNPPASKRISSAKKRIWIWQN